MKLIRLHEGFVDNIKNAMGLSNFKKLQDPNRFPTNKNMPERSGNQDTPLTPRQRRFFNAPLGGTTGKTGYGEIDNEESKHAKDSSVGDDTKDSSLEYPQDQNELGKELAKKARQKFGHLAVSGPRPRLKL